MPGEAGAKGSLSVVILVGITGVVKELSAVMGTVRHYSTAGTLLHTTTTSLRSLLHWKFRVERFDCPHDVIAKLLDSDV